MNRNTPLFPKAETTIHSSNKDPGNAANMSRDITVSYVKDRFVMKFTNYWLNGGTCAFAISRKAAEELMTALDVMLSADADGDAVEEAEPEPEQRVLRFEARSLHNNRIWAAFRLGSDAEMFVKNITNQHLYVRPVKSS